LIEREEQIETHAVHQGADSRRNRDRR
jgi:hypothetical protein